jgi:hypothetical protein
MADDTVWLTEQLAAVEARILVIQAAITRVVSRAQSYSTDTGQTRISKEEVQLASLRLQLKDEEARRNDIRNQLGLGNTAGRQVYVIPDY